MKIGFIGLGNLGTPIAENLLEQNKNLYVYNRTIEKTTPLKDKGAIVCNSVKELASTCDVVFTIVSNDAAIKQITDGSDGIAANLKSGGIHVSMSTILPVTSNELFKQHKQYNNHYIACPVLGRPEAAKAKKLNFLVSGNEKIVAVIKPLLTQAGAAGIWEYGSETGASNAAKLCSNYMIQAALQSMAEGINLAKKSGIDETAWMNMLTSTLFNCGIYINYGKLVLEEKFTPASFTMELGLKDSNLINQQAETVSAKMPLAKMIKEEYEQLIKDGYADYDWSAIALAVK
jgi:3-hydroxyisobutyrate dehydrogenase-like beta-hydroxyacid dehydrogenase